MNYNDKNNINQNPIPGLANPQKQLPQHLSGELQNAMPGDGDDEDDEDGDWDEGQYDDYEVALDTIMA